MLIVQQDQEETELTLHKVEMPEKQGPKEQIEIELKETQQGPEDLLQVHQQQDQIMEELQE